jgi:hypothetical protein
MIDPLATTPLTSTTDATSSTSSSASKSDDVSQGFEKLLLQQLTQEMMKTVSAWSSDDDSSDDDSGDSGSSDALGGAYASMLPDALTNAVEQGGGLGLDLGLGSSATSLSSPDTATTTDPTA